MRKLKIMPQKNNINPAQGCLPLSKEYQFDAFVFDMDNVLIDTRKSYLEVIRKTIDTYLTSGSVPLFTATEESKKSSLLSPEDIDTFKHFGGFNDDWDCCYGLLVYLLSLNPKKRDMDHLKKEIDLKKLSKKVTERPLRSSGIVKICGRQSAVKIEKISQIFQEIYLGKELFPLVSSDEMYYWKKRGLIEKERAIFKKSFFEKLKDKGLKLGIATGRSLYEAQYALKKFDLLNYFDAITTIDEVKPEEKKQKKSLRKPHPFSLIETAKKIGKKKKFLYIGDLPDDVMAANAAKESVDFHSSAFPVYASDPDHAIEEIKKASPDFIIQKPADLLKLAGI